jgi:hypothetical protein
LDATASTPRARSAAVIAAARTVLPAAVSVPVMNQPRKRRGTEAYAARSTHMGSGAS